MAIWETWPTSILMGVSKMYPKMPAQGPQGRESIHLHKVSGTQDSTQTKMEADGWVSRPQGWGQGQEGDS